ncbi:MAG: hypothetical protein ACREPY_02315 [Rhodanobacteraceae bacterium]
MLKELARLSSRMLHRQPGGAKKSPRRACSDNPRVRDAKAGKRDWRPRVYW